MPKYPTCEGQPIFGVDQRVIGLDGKPVYNPDGKVKKERACMAEGWLYNGKPQSLYFPLGHKHEGNFKGMVQILEERGYVDVKGLHYKCPSFKCPQETHCCCCQRLLYNKPDFVKVESLLEVKCRAQGFTVIFLPKFHCKINPIEQVWCHPKRTYRMKPASSRSNDLKANVIEALKSVDLEHIRRYEHIQIKLALLTYLF
jgi:hypothetical protein